MQEIASSRSTANLQLQTTPNFKEAYAINWLALQCLKPMHHFSKWSIHSLHTPIKPGEFGNAQTREFEVFSRVFKISASILTFPIQLTGLLFSGMIDLVADSFSSSGYTYLSGIEEKKGSLQESFMTFNACMLWGGLPILFGGVRPFCERIDKASTFILEKSPDILVMQEVCFEAGLALWDKLKSHYSHGFTRIGPMPFLALDTGLFVASKHPIIKKPIFIPIETGKTLKRGLFYFETALNAVFVTHLEAGDDKKDSEMRKKQLEKIIEEMQKVSGKPALLLGDLNIHKADSCSDEYTNSGIPKYFNDFHKEPITETNATCTNQLTAIATGNRLEGPSWEHIDYILHLKSSSVEDLSIRTISTYDLERPDEALSDHKALLAKKRI
jgi:endonuclease/exonuclease/phosphatase family metal-dependent hydrolase